MAAAKHFFFFLSLLLFSNSLYAQDSEGPSYPVFPELEAPQKSITPMLNNMSVEEKLKLLEYLRHLGVDIDKEIQYAYEQVDDKSKEKALKFAYTQQAENGKNQRTYVKWDKDTLNFGEIEEGTILMDSFEVANVGANPYFINNIKTTCDCTVLDKPDFPVMPNEKEIIRIQFDSQGKLGPVETGIVIYDNSRPNIRSILYIKGAVVPKSNGPEPKK